MANNSIPSNMVKAVKVTDRRRESKIYQACAGCGGATYVGQDVWYVPMVGVRCLSCGKGEDKPAIVQQVPASIDVDLLQAEVAALRNELAKVREEVAAKVGNVTAQKVEVTIRPANVVNTVESPHQALARVLKLVHCGIRNIYLVGPAGTGKTTLLEQVGQALGLQTGEQSLSGGVTESQLLGSRWPQADGSVAYEMPEFVRVYSQGGVFLLDEVDGMDSNVGVALNMALANGKVVTKGGTFKRHESTILLCAANTFGTGATAQYVGRNALDAATLDRFACAMVQVDYDRNVEERRAAANCGDATARQAFLTWCWAMRARTAELKMKRVVSTRLVINGSAMLGGGFTLVEVKEAFLGSWSTDERAKVASL